MKIKPLQAFNGDSILVSFPSENKIINILIDGGVPRTYQRTLKPTLLKLADDGQCINLLIVTHIDDDHIGGIKELYQDVNFDISIVKKVWFNSGKLLSDCFSSPQDIEREVKLIKSDTTQMSVKQGVTLEKELLKTDDVWACSLIKAGHTELFYGAKITVLSPNESQLNKLNIHWETEINDEKNMSGNTHDDFQLTIDQLIKNNFVEDTRVPNGSSISLLIEVNDKYYLFLADSHPSPVEESLRLLGFDERNKLYAEFVKIAHHSSKFNTSPSLLSIISSHHFFVSTDGGSHGLPNKEPLARIIVQNPGVTIHFNYEQIAKEIFFDDDFKKYKFSIKYSIGTDYIFED